MLFRVGPLRYGFAAMSKTFTTSDVASHNKSDDLFIIVDGDVFDLTKFQDDHPGNFTASSPKWPRRPC